MELVGDLVATRGSEPMRPSKEELSHGAESAIDLVSAVEELHRRSSLELHKSLKENEDFCICCCSEKGLSVKIDVEKLAGLLPLHLIAVLMTSDRDEEMFRYLLSGIRLLHTLCDLAPRHTKLEQVLLEDVKLSEQMLDLVFYSLIVLGGNGQGSCRSDGLSLMQTTLVASCLYLLHGFISPQWQDLVQVLLAHPKVDVFIDAAFGAVHNVVRSLQMKLLSQGTDLLTKSGIYYERAVNYHCQQAESALQFLHSLCQQKPFRERLAKNKELCGNGGVLMLAQSILSLTVPPQLDGSATMTASISRMKAKVLSILLHLFEAESVSFLDEVASAGNLRLAESIATEVLELLRLGLSKASKDFTASSDYPMGFVLLNAMRLADVFTDDSNFRSFFTQHFSEVLSAIFLLPHGEFLSMWCSSDLPSREDEATLDYDQFASAGWILDSFSSSSDQPIATQFKLNLLPSNHPKASYVHQRTSFFIKMIANLHCFVPNICEEQERNRFIHNFTGGLQRDPSSILPGFSYALTTRRGASVCRNLSSLLSHAESLIPNFLNEEDLLLLRVFFNQLQPLIRSEFEESQVQETQSTGGYSSAKQRKESLNLNNGNSNLNEETSENSAFRAEGVTRQGIKEERESIDRSKIVGENDADAHNLETSGSDTSSTRGKSCIDRVEDGELLKTDKRSKESGTGGVKEDEKVETVQGVEKQRRKRKRSIMNDEQMAMIERALLDEPDMQRNSASIQTWADKLSHYGSEVTTSQLKNWLNNRKAKLARASKQAGPARDNSSGDLPDSPGEENISQKPSTLKGSNQVASRSARTGENSKSSGEAIKTGQLVALMDEKGEEVGRGKVERTDGKWYGVSLDATGACVVDVVELTGCDKRERLPYPLEAVGSTFEEAESRFGVMRVAWDASKLRNAMH